MLRSSLIAASCCALLVGVSACSSSTGAGSPSGPPSSGGSSGGSLSPAAAGAKTITFGLANDEGAGVNFPEYRIGAEAAVKYINANGGVNGSQIKLIICKADGSPEGSINCANKFIDAKVAAYVAGLDVSSDAALSALKSAGIPYVTPTAWGDEQAKDSNAFDLHTASDAFSVAAIKALADAGAKNIANFHYAIPHSVQAEPAYNAAAAKDGVKLFHVQVPATGADWSAAVTTALAKKADAMIGFFNEADCTNLVRAARAAGFTGLIAVGSCSDYVKALGAASENTITVADKWPTDLRSSAPPAVQKQLDTYVAAMKADGNGDLASGLARNSYSTLIELATIMKGISGPITAATLKTALNGIRDIPGDFGPELKCADHPWPSQPRTCSSEVLAIKVVKGPNGPKRVAVGGGFVDVAPFAG